MLEVQNQTSKPQFGMLHAPVFAFFSKEFYGAVATSWKGTGILYLFLMVTISWSVASISTGVLIDKGVHDKDFQAFVTQLPAMNFSGGKLVIDKPLPYFIKAANSDVVIAAFVQEHKDAQLKQDDPPIVLTPDMMLVKDRNEPLSFADLDKVMPGLKVSSADLKTFTDGLAVSAAIGLFVIGIVPIFLSHLLLALFYGGVELAMTSAMEVGIGFQASLRLAAVAMTPTIVISTLFTIARTLAPSIADYQSAWWWISGLISLGFLVLAAFSAKAARPETAGSSEP